MRFPVRRIVLGFAVGIGAGWVAGLLRRPKDAPPGTGADAAEHMPQEEFGDVAELAPEAGHEPEDHAPPRKAVPEMITPPPGRDQDPPEAPAIDVDAGASEPATPARARRARKADSARAVSDSMSEAVREGRAEVTERLAGLEDSVTPPEPRRRKR